MRFVYPICCGVDVHKTFFVATLIISEGITPRYSKKDFQPSIILYLHLNNG